MADLSGCMTVSETLTRKGNGVTFDHLGVIVELLSPERVSSWDDVHVGLVHQLQRKKGEVEAESVGNPASIFVCNLKFQMSFVDFLLR